MTEINFADKIHPDYWKTFNNPNLPKDVMEEELEALVELIEEVIDGTDITYIVDGNDGVWEYEYDQKMYRLYATPDAGIIPEDMQTFLPAQNIIESSGVKFIIDDGLCMIEGMEEINPEFSKILLKDAGYDED